MRRRALTLLFVLLAAPIWAPSSAFAAKTNTLTAASVMPLAGTPATIFSFVVSYSSAASVPAQSVWADVAGKTVALTLIVGTRIRGVWAGGSRLPTGTWSVTFAAKPLTGNKATLRGPTVVVTGASPNPGGPSGGAGGGSSGPAASPVAAPGGTSATPTPGSGTTTATPPGAPSMNPAPGSPTPSATVTSGAPTPHQPGSGVGSDASTRPAPGASGATHGVGSASARPGPASSTVASAISSAQPSRTSNPVGLDDPAASLRVAIELVGVAALSLLGLLLVRRRRRQEEAMATPHPSPAPPPNVELDLSRRSRAAARKRVDPSDDPILRAMGLDPEAPAAAGASKLRARARRLDRQPPDESSAGSPPKLARRR